MKKLLILANSDSAIFKFRTELIESLSNDFKIGIGIPFGQYMKEIANEKYEFYNVPVNRHGLNPIEDIKLIFSYHKLIKKFKPDVVLQYTIKPNLYGSIVCGWNKIPCICNITGLGSAVETPGALQKMLIIMYKFAMLKVHTIFFQNEHGREFFIKNHIGKISQYFQLPGSGVNLSRFKPLDYPDVTIQKFLFVARVIKEKGIEEFLYTAEEFKKLGLKAEFHICGACEEAYQDILKKKNDEGIIVYHGLVKDMRKMYEDATCITLPSYYPEGQSNVLLEGAASCRPLITTDHPGCREAVNDGETGFLVRKKDTKDLFDKCLAMYNKSVEERKTMGLAGRKKIEEEFDRNIVINAYRARISSLGLL